MKIEDINGQEVVLRFTKDEMEQLTKWMQLAEALPHYECEMPSWTYRFMALHEMMRVADEANKHKFGALWDFPYVKATIKAMRDRIKSSW